MDFSFSKILRFCQFSLVSFPNLRSLNLTPKKIFTGSSVTIMKASGTMLGKQRKLAADATTASKELQMSFKNTSNVASALTKDRV